jgi:hypothetical protein
MKCIILTAISIGYEWPKQANIPPLNNYDFFIIRIEFIIPGKHYSEGLSGPIWKNN